MFMLELVLCDVKEYQACRTIELTDKIDAMRKRSASGMQLPLAELASSFYSVLKAQTSGYATFDYEPGPHRASDLVRMDFLIHGSAVDALSRIIHRDDALSTARNVCKKLVDAVSRQSFEVCFSVQYLHGTWRCVVVHGMAWGGGGWLWFCVHLPF